MDTTYELLKFEYDKSSVPDFSVFNPRPPFMETAGKLYGEYYHEGFGATNLDARNALSHANVVLTHLLEIDQEKESDILSHHNVNFTPYDRRDTIYTLNDDYRHYFLCVLKGTGEKKILRELTEAALYYGLADDVFLTTQPIFLDILEAPENNTDIKGSNLPAFDDLFLKAGDAALYHQHYIDCAYRLYYLIQWHKKILEIESYNFHDSNADPRDKDALEKWERFSKYYEQLRDGNSEIILPDDEASLYGLHFYNGLVTLQDRQGIEKHVLELLDSFYANLTKTCNGKVDLNQLRTIALMDINVCKKYLIFIVSHLAGDSSEMQETLRSSAISKLRTLTGTKYGTLAFYQVKIEQDYHNLLDYAVVATTVEDITYALRARDTLEQICYYTSLSSLSYMLPDHDQKHPEDIGKLTVMNVSYMNDPNEGRIIKKILYGEEGKESGRKSVSVPYVFLKCFSRQADYLPMWEMYGNHAEGICLVINWPKTRKNKSNVEAPLYYVCYVKKDGNDFSIRKSDNPYLADWKEINDWLHKIRTIARKKGIDAAIIDSLLGNMTYLFKDESYSYEQEVRVLYSFENYSDYIVKRTAGETPMLYVQPDFPVYIDEVILGPKFKDVALKIPYLQAELEQMSQKTMTKMPDITLSSIEYR